jgi:methionine transaminase
MNLQTKLPDVGVTIFTVMSQMANESGAINLSQGFPDFDAPAALVDKAAAYMGSGHNQYAPMQGVMPLREKIAAKTKMLYGAEYDPVSEITVTSGATEALFAAITAVVNPGDEVLVFEPAYDSYVPAILLNGGKPVFLQYKFPEYKIDWNQVADAITGKTRLIILNSPHNPSGAILDTQDIAALTDIVRDSNIFIVSDEVYEHIVFDGRRHESITRYPELVARSFVISSFGKTYHATGWKIGYCVAPKKLSVEFQKIHQFVTFASNTPIQLALADFMDNTAAYLDLGAFYQKRRDLFVDLLAGSRFKPSACLGTYFLMVDYSEISDEPDMDFAKRLTRKYGVAAIPPSVFYHNHIDHKVVRFCFAKRDETLKEAARILCQI